MNDTTREIGGALGVAILGSITNAIYASTITGNSAFPALEQASPQVAAAVQDSIGSAVVVAQTVGGTVGATIQQISNQAFVDALSRRRSSPASSRLVARPRLLLPAGTRRDRRHRRSTRRRRRRVHAPSATSSDATWPG